MFANLQLQDKDQTYKNIWPKDIEAVKKYKLQDGETSFMNIMMIW